MTSISRVKESLRGHPSYYNQDEVAVTSNLVAMKKGEVPLLVCIESAPQELLPEFFLHREALHSIIT